MRRRSKHLIDNEAGFDLEVMGGASAASRLLVELPTLLWQGFEDEAFGSGLDFVAVVPWQLRLKGAVCFPIAF